MTIGKVTKKDSRFFARTYKYMKKNTDNLTLKDFADLIEFMNETGERNAIGSVSQQGGAARQANRPVLGLGHFLNQRNLAARANQASRLNNQASRPNNQPVRVNNQTQRPNIQASRMNNQGPAPPAPRQRTAIPYRRNDWPAPPEPERKRENERARLPIQPPGGRVRVEYIEQ